MGLCQTCNHARNCMFRPDPSLPVIHCEEFDGYAAPSIVEPAAEAQAVPTAADLNEQDQYKGLCVNCENRRDCAIRNKEIGVWHCEEYS